MEDYLRAFRYEFRAQVKCIGTRIFSNSWLNFVLAFYIRGAEKRINKLWWGYAEPFQVTVYTLVTIDLENLYRFARSH